MKPAPALALVALAPAIAVAQTAAWPMFRGDPGNTGRAATPLPEKLAVVWKFQLDDGTTSTAAIADGRVYIGGDDGRIVALDRESGALHWQFTARDAIESSPTVLPAGHAPGVDPATLVVFGDNAGEVYALDAETGRKRWSYATRARVVSSVVPAGEALVFGSYDGGVYCLRSGTGELLWRYDVKERVHGTPAVVHSSMHAAPASAPVAASSPSTTRPAGLLHAAGAGAQAPSTLPAGAAYVLVAGCDAHLHVLRLADGALVRRVGLDTVSGAAVAAQGGFVYLPGYAEQVVAVDWIAGEVTWRFEDTDRPYPFLASAALAGELVIVGGRDKRVRALRADTGQQAWQFAARGKVDSSPVVVGTRVFVGSSDGILYELELTTGRERWRYECGGAITASPAVAASRLVVGTDQGTVYCFGAVRTE